MRLSAVSVRPAFRLPTSSFCQIGAEHQVGKPGPSALHDQVARRWVAVLGKIATEARNLDEVGRECPRWRSGAKFRGKVFGLAKLTTRDMTRTCYDNMLLRMNHT